RTSRSEAPQIADSFYLILDIFREGPNGALPMLPFDAGKSGSISPLVPVSNQNPAGAAPMPPAPAGFPPGAAPGVPSAVPGPSAAPNLMDIVRALRRRWVPALGGGLLCGVVAALVTWHLVPPAKYWTAATLRINPYLPKLHFETSEARPDFDLYRLEQAVLIKTRHVLNAALRDPKVSGLGSVRGQIDPVDWLSNQIQVDFPGYGGILRIGMSGDDPQEVTLLVNAVTEAYLREIVEAERNERLARFDQLQRIYDGLQKSLETKRKTLRELAESLGSDDKPTLAYQQQLALHRQDLAMQDLMQVQSELRKVQAELRVEQARVDAARASPISDHMVEQVIQQDDLVQKYVLQIHENQRNLEYARRLARGHDVTTEHFQRELERLKKDLANRRERLRPIVWERLHRERDSELAARTSQLQTQKAVLDELAQTLSEEVSRFKEGQVALGKKTLDLGALQDQIKHAETTADRIGEELERRKVELQAAPRITLLEKAVPPHARDEKRRIKATAMAGFGALGFVVVCVSWWEFRARRISTVDEVVRGLGMRVVGALPVLPERARLGLDRSDNPRDRLWHSLLVESVDATRTMLLHAARAESLRVVMVTSSLAGEGKTSLASHLATSLARAGLRTLLIDCDLRKPALHSLFDLPLDPGFCEVLRGEVEVGEVARPTAVSGIWMITAGQCDSLAIQALAQGNVRAVLDWAKEHYDFIIIDSAPSLPVADSLMIGQHVDAAILSILRDVSRVPKVQAACERIAALGIRVLGAVVAASPGDLYGYEAQYPVRSSLD
ncbi:MAG: AAA family ATPase, partial [Isosphaeraceae bacterium]|nr:AAA family ATPase [Isosphaeraceae bacterium]